jgi:hypothetical protein
MGHFQEDAECVVKEIKFTSFNVFLFVMFMFCSCNNDGYNVEW